MPSKPYRRGYPVAILVGIEKDKASIWQIYSQVAKLQQTVPLVGDRKDQKATYNFHEAIVNALRLTLKQGVRNIIVASPPRTGYSQEFQSHLAAHHAWLLRGDSKATVNQIAGSASTAPQVNELAKTAEFKQLIQETADQETSNLLEILEKQLNAADNMVFFSLEEAENLILYPQPPGKPQPDYLLLTDQYLAGIRQKNRVQRLMQIAQNKKVKTRVISAESNAGKRLTQLGGVVCLAKKQ